MGEKGQDQAVTIFGMCSFNQSSDNSFVANMDSVKSSDSYNCLPIRMERRYVVINFQEVILVANLVDTFQFQKRLQFNQKHLINLLHLVKKYYFLHAEGE